MRYPWTEVLYVPGKGRGSPQPALRYLPTQLRSPAPGRAPVVPLRAASGWSPQPRCAEGTVIRSMKFLGSQRLETSVLEPSRSHPGQRGSRRVPVTLGQLSGGCTRGAERGERGTAGQAEGTSPAGAAHSSRTPEPSERLTGAAGALVGGDCTQRRGAAVQ